MSGKTKKVEVILYSVGFGDSIYIKLDDGIEILIDTGYSSKTTEVIKKIKKEGRKIDYIFLTHEHSDHINGISKILDDSYFTIRGVFYWMPINSIKSPSKVKKINSLTQKLIHDGEKVFSQSINNSSVNQISDIFGERIEILYPFIFNESEYDTKDKNANSIVVSINIGEYKMLFMGDATREVEELILDNYKDKDKLGKVILWKVGHHCSDTCSCEEFYNEIIGDSLKKSVVSCKNSWNGTKANRKPPSYEKVQEINSELDNNKKSKLEFTGKNGKGKDIRLEFELSGGKINVKDLL